MKIPEGMTPKDKEIGLALTGLLMAAKMHDYEAFRVVWDDLPEKTKPAIAASLADGMIQLLRIAFPGIHISKTLQNTALFIEQLGGMPPTDPEEGTDEAF